MTAPFKLSDTSALVMLLMGDSIHTSSYSRRYRAMLDLSPGRDLMERCTSVWPHLNELVWNRKSAILEETASCIRDGIRQVIIFGSGIDSLSLEAIALNDTVRVYEVDAYHMDYKREMVDKVTPDASRIECVEADLELPDETARKVADAGWSEDAPTLLVLEGITYYIKQDVLWSIVKRFSRRAANRVVMEYIVPRDRIDSERAHIPDIVFGTIQQSLPEYMDISRFGYDTIMERAREVGATGGSRYTMRSMERRRTGANRFFPTDSSGWIEVACFRTSPGKRTPDGV